MFSCAHVCALKSHGRPQPNFPWHLRLNQGMMHFPAVCWVTADSGMHRDFWVRNQADQSCNMLNRATVIKEIISSVANIKSVIISWTVPIPSLKQNTGRRKQNSRQTSAPRNKPNVPLKRDSTLYNGAQAQNWFNKWRQCNLQGQNTTKNRECSDIVKYECICVVLNMRMFSIATLISYWN